MFASPGPILFDLGFFKIHWYGLTFALAFVSMLFVGSQELKKAGYKEEEFQTLIFILVLAGIVCARLYYVLFNLDYYGYHPLESFKIWHGGLAIHGGILGGVIAGYVYTQIRKLNFWFYADIVALGLPLAQAIGRWGNFFNSEAFGIPTDLPWKIYIPEYLRPPEFREFAYFHPTFLYESCANLIIFIILHRWIKRRVRQYEGVIFGSYLIMYSFVRIFTESLRTDSLMWLNSIKMAQVMSVMFIVIGFTILGLKLIKMKERG